MRQPTSRRPRTAQPTFDQSRLRKSAQIQRQQSGLGTSMVPIECINFVVGLLNSIVRFATGLWEALTSQTLELDSGRKVRIGKKIAEGGFSFVFRATDCSDSTRLYALKRIQCIERDVVKACQREAEVHRKVAANDGNNKNVLHLLGMTFVDKSCFMLFPFLPHSLRAEINRRIFDNHDVRDGNTLPPWSEVTALQIFRGILNGVHALHRSNYSHRDIKPENVLFAGPNDLSTPVLMDFGSVGTLMQPIATRQHTMLIAETASIHTTMPYRPPELFDGGVRTGDPDVDFTKVDVWSLGCTLFAILYGTSPFESEFSRQTGAIRVVDCSQLRVIGNIPSPPPKTGPARWYSSQMRDLIEWILQQNRSERPSLEDLIDRVGSVLAAHNGDHLDVMV